MAFSVTIHFDNSPSFAAPHVWIWYDGSVATQDDFAATDNDTFGPIFHVQSKRKDFNFKFKQGPGGGLGIQIVKYNSRPTMYIEWTSLHCSSMITYFPGR